MIGHRIVSSFHAALHLGWEYVCVCGILSRPRPALDLLFTSTGMMMGWLLLADLMPFNVDLSTFVDREPFGGHASNVRLLRYPGTNNYCCFGDDRSTIVPSFHFVLHLG